MPQSLLSAILPSNAFQVFNETTNQQIWKSLAIKQVQIDESSSNSQKPISDIQPAQNSTQNQILTQDIEASKIIQPSRLTIVGYVPDLSTAESIIWTWLSRTTTIAVTSRGVISPSMAITQLSFEQAPDMLSAQKVTMQLEQAAVPTFNQYSPAQASDSNTYGIKIQTPPSITTTVTDLYNTLASDIGAIL